MNQPNSTKTKKSKTKKANDQEIGSNDKEFLDQITKEVAVKLESYYSGPIPSPQHMQGYKNVQEDLPNRIMNLTEKEQSHQHQLQIQITEYKTKATTRNSYMAFFIIVLLVLVGTFLIYNDKDIVGLGSLVAAAGVLIAAFLRKEKPDQKEIAKQKAD